MSLLLSPTSSAPTQDAIPPSQTSVLLALPAEIILLIVENLPPTAAASLSYSCRVLRSWLEPEVDSLLDQVKTQSIDTLRGFRLELLCMLEMDGRIPYTKAVCSGCAQTHDKKHFTALAIAKAPSSRQCRGRECCVWVCPHRQFTYGQLRAYEEGKLELPHSCPDKKQNWSSDGHDPCIALLWWYNTESGSKRTDQRDRLVELTARLHLPLNLCHGHGSRFQEDALYAPICPHIQADQSFIEHLYNHRQGIIYSSERLELAHSSSSSYREELSLAQSSASGRTTMEPLCKGYVTKQSPTKWSDLELGTSGRRRRNYFCCRFCETEIYMIVFTDKTTLWWNRRFDSVVDSPTHRDWIASSHSPAQVADLNVRWKE